MADESQSFDNIRRKFNNVPEKPLIPQQAYDSPTRKAGHRSIDWLTKDAGFAQHHGDDKLASGQAVNREFHPKSPRQQSDGGSMKPEVYIDEAAGRALKDKVRHMEQIAARSKQQAERPGPPGKQAGPSGRTVSLTAANAGPTPPAPGAGPRRTVSMTAGNSEAPPAAAARNGSGSTPPTSPLSSVGSIPPMIAEEGDSGIGAGSGPSLTAPEHATRADDSEASGEEAWGSSHGPADTMDVATLRRLLSQREIELASERALVKQYEAARIRRASSSSSDSSSSGRSSSQLLEAQPVIIQVKEWGDKEAQELRTALHLITGAYKTAMERIGVLEEELQRREALDAAAEIRNKSRTPIASERV